MNVADAVEYLRSIGVDVGEETAHAWNEQQTVHRLERRRHKAELKRSCGHFRTYWCTIRSAEGTVYAKSCRDCRKYVEYRDKAPAGAIP